MADILRATARVPGFAEAARLHLIETSPALRAEQARRLPDGTTWHDTASDLPDLPLFLVANEFFDALPVRQFRRDGGGWREALVDQDGASFIRRWSEPFAEDKLTHRLDDTRAGDIVEICPALPGITAQIAGRIAARGGAALIIDYGDWRSLGDTVQAVQAHAPVDPLTAPGRTDITAHVDFEALAGAAAPARFSRLAPQGVFLERLGITDRAQRLAAGLAGDALENLIAAHRRLTAPQEMGSLFKVMGLYPDGAPPPAGLEP